MIIEFVVRVSSRELRCEAETWLVPRKGKALFDFTSAFDTPAWEYVPITEVDNPPPNEGDY